ncbi:hypothetical protein ACFE04_011770 [Oxalis oulophora]
MGCVSSKQAVSTNDDTLFKLAPSSFAVFDINAVQEPWLKPIDLDSGDVDVDHLQKPTHVPAPILEKLNKLEFNGINTAPGQTWDEISKALQDSINNKILDDDAKSSPPKPQLDDKSYSSLMKKPRRKSKSFHTLEDLDDTKVTFTESKSKPASAVAVGLNKKAESTGTGISRSVKENIFIMQDRLEKEKEGKQAQFDRLMQIRRDPLSQFPQKCPPGGTDSLILYTTTLRGVRRTFEDCTRVRNILELHGVIFDERDVSLHGEFLVELKELMGEELSVPRVFLKGRYLGGVDEVSELNETGRLGRLLTAARVERGLGRQVCEGCGGARFVPCMDCGGSCKVYNEGVKERCGECNENGLIHCPACN